MRDRLKIQRQKTITPTYTQPNLAQKRQNFSFSTVQPQIATEQKGSLSGRYTNAESAHSAF